MGVTICKACRFAERRIAVAERRLAVVDPNPTGHCLSTDAPISDHVDGFKYCKDINKKGDCEFFEGIKTEKQKRITEEEYKEIDSKLQSVIETLHYLVTCNQEQPEGITCYHASSFEEPIEKLIEARRILVKGGL